MLLDLFGLLFIDLLINSNNGNNGNKNENENKKHFTTMMIIRTRNEIFLYIIDK